MYIQSSSVVLGFVVGVARDVVGVATVVISVASIVASGSGVRVSSVMRVRVVVRVGAIAVRGGSGGGDAVGFFRHIHGCFCAAN